MDKLSALEKARAAQRKPRLSMRQAINAKCKECIYDPLAGLGAWRQQVEACASVNCPLHPVRPTSTASRDDQ